MHRGYWDYDGGGLGDMGQHILDPIRHAMGKDDTHPVEIIPHAPPAHPDATVLWGWVRMKYADGAELVIESGEWSNCPKNGIRSGSAIGKFASVKGILQDLPEVRHCLLWSVEDDP